MLVIDGFPMDVALVEEPTYSATLTSFPMEGGSSVNDHLQHDPDTLQIECIVSDTPFQDVEIARMLDEKSLSSSDEVLPSDRAYMRLLQLKSTGEPVSVDTSLDFFEDMVLTTMTPTRMGDAIKYTCTFQRATFVTNERTTIRVAVPRVQPKKPSGPKAADAFAGEPIIWCKERRPDGTCARSEHVGFDAKTQQFIHPNGTPLSEDELEDMRADNKRQYEIDNAPDANGVRPDGSMTWQDVDVTKSPVPLQGDAPIKRTVPRYRVTR